MYFFAMESVGAILLHFLRFFAMHFFCITFITISTVKSSEIQPPTTPPVINHIEENVLNVLMNTQLNQPSYVSPLSVLNANTTICDTLISTAHNENPLISFLCALHQLKKAPQINSTSNMNTCIKLPPPPDINLETYSSSVSSQNRSQDKNDDLDMIISQSMSNYDTQALSKSVILILGNTGSGKTTLSQLIAGNLSRLHGVLNSSNKLVIVNEDDMIGQIGAPSMKSEKIKPEYITNPLTNDSFYDCPGFDDNRGAGTDTAAMFSLKSITDSIKQAKFLFTVPHSSVRIGNDLLDFDLLTRHAARFLKNMSNTMESIGLIVTKVNSYSSLGHYLSDDEILGEIVDFLLRFRQTLHERLQSKNGDTSEIHRKIQFIEAILKRESDNGPYERIWFVRELLKCGPFSEIPYVSQVRQIITDLFQNKMSFAEVNSSNFGITLNNATLLKVEQSFIPEIKTKIENETNELVHKLRNEFLLKLNSSLERDDDDVRRETISKLKMICDRFSKIKNITFSSTTIVSEIIPEILKQFKGKSGEDEVKMNQILREEQLLAFFQFLTNKSADNSFLTLIVTELGHDLSQVRETTWNRIQNEFVGNLHINMADEFSSLITHLETLYFNHIQQEMTKRNKINSTLKSIRSQYTVIRRLSSTSLSQEDLVDQLYSSLGFEVDPRHIRKLYEIENMYSFYEQITNAPILREINSLTTGISGLTEKISDVGHWYGFVLRVDSILSKYSAQVMLRNVSKETFEGFEDDLTFLEEYNLIYSIPPVIRNISRDGRVEEGMKQQLHEIILLAMAQKATFTCENVGEKVVIKGRFVKFSDFLTDDDQFTFPCRNGLKELQIFASETVFIDKDILARGKELHLSILAPKWEVVAQGQVGQKRLISLDGRHGASFENNPRAYSGDDYGKSGKDGEPGQPGENGGTLFGLYHELVNSHLLKISVDGGDGGAGQHGGHGYRGRDGRNGEEDDFPNPYTFSLSSITNKELKTYGFLVDVMNYHNWIVKQGTPGGRGGNGGDGGVGGKGGHPGFITIHSVSIHENQGDLDTSRRIGHVGRNGEGGLYARGGKDGDNFGCTFRNTYGSFRWSPCEPVPVDKRAENGTNGMDGGNSIGQIFPSPPSPPANHWEVITDYEGFVLESESDAGMQFLREIESNSYITESYTK
ncbi:unnamed protein product [Orchesella dallaii]|uniref:AAA+ ATPase domain-containing protein n=1 Tax=Orchesella dallaii TaxID=48710 RepID=A0ABP1QDQ8_9HEXA